MFKRLQTEVSNVGKVIDHSVATAVQQTTKVVSDVSQDITTVTTSAAGIPVSLANAQLAAFSSARKHVVSGSYDETFNNIKEILVRNVTAIPTMGQVEARNVYIEILRKQVSTWHALPASLITILKKYYAINFENVRFTTNIMINPFDDQYIGITLDHDIFFKNSIDLNIKSDLATMLHELEHVQQYEAHEGFPGFMAKYVTQSTGCGFSHDVIPLEQEAEAKSQRIIDEVYKEFSGHKLAQNRK
jgi:hypothetical protein